MRNQMVPIPFAFSAVAMLSWALMLIPACASKQTDSPSAKAKTRGVLMDWDNEPLPGDVSPREYLDGMAKTMSELPGDVVVESKTNSQLVLTMDMAKAARAMAPRADPNSTETAPTRLEWRVVEADGQRIVESRRYYIGKDEKVIEECRKNVEHKAKATGQQPPIH
jgi:hypothetical protein